MLKKKLGVRYNAPSIAQRNEMLKKKWDAIDNVPATFRKNAMRKLKIFGWITLVIMLDMFFG